MAGQDEQTTQLSASNMKEIFQAQLKKYNEELDRKDAEREARRKKLEIKDVFQPKNEVGQDKEKDKKQIQEYTNERIAKM